MPLLTAPDGTRIAYRDRSGPGIPVLLLHGLAGHLGEWDDLAARLVSAGHRVVAYDARGHGASTRRPASVSRAAHVGDAVAVEAALDLGPAVVVGQSMGGSTAMLLAAGRPELVRSLVLVEAGPAGPRACPADHAGVAGLGTPVCGVVVGCRLPHARTTSRGGTPIASPPSS
ncbi:alpha/beta hydrolase, partial [Streptomyces sp. NPDC047072]|uniref:alpha/beta fold hydrolase n=1 Tax=Streptomyces sp. NPDC047072 TaxID=3154809 RepID=UPI0033DEB3A6